MTVGGSPITQHGCRGYGNSNAYGYVDPNKYLRGNVSDNWIIVTNIRKYRFSILLSGTDVFNFDSSEFSDLPFSNFDF